MVEYFCIFKKLIKVNKILIDILLSFSYLKKNDVIITILCCIYHQTFINLLG